LYPVPYLEFLTFHRIMWCGASPLIESLPR
jgi:hypothetical protein